MARGLVEKREQAAYFFEGLPENVQQILKETRGVWDSASYSYERLRDEVRDYVSTRERTNTYLHVNHVYVEVHRV